MYSGKTIKEYLNELASKNPTPGGGSAAALVGATGAALLSKVVNFTIGKEKYKAFEEEMKNILGRSEGIRKNFLKLCSEDAVVYKKLSDAFKLPKDNKERKERIQNALKEALDVPLRICKDSREASKLCLPVAEKGNPNLITDTAIASILFKDAYESGLLNVEINLKSIDNDSFVTETKDTLKQLGKEIDNVNKKIIEETKGRLK